ncbi:PAS domain-containing protein [Sphingomonas sp. Root710]|uniref:PAS domain-containing protein n=1 Tax=Sphingomonas sp. Root710 TaxID=1736594 RepID=UPI001F2F8CA7|nr:PAS domain-containing protein [Sphingomonas sp. Root710]
MIDDIAHEQGSGDPFFAAVRATRMPMVITDPRQPDNPIVFCNRAFQTLSGYTRDEILGRNCRFLQGPETDRATVREIHDAVEAGRDCAVDLLNYRKDGSTFWNALYLSPVRGATGEIQFFFASQLDVTDRIEAHRTVAAQKAEVEREVVRRTAALQAALEEKTMLLNEVDHRVKNNLTMVGSLLRLQTRQNRDPSAEKPLNTMLQRIDALASVNRGLYQGADVKHFDVGAFARRLADDLVEASGQPDADVTLNLQPVTIPAEHAAAFGLIMNELLANALDHGGTADAPLKIVISILRDDDHGELVVSDNGPGFDANSSAENGMGIMLVRRLAKQFGGDVFWDSDAKGGKVTMSFPLELA